MRVITNRHWRVWDDDYTPEWGDEPEPSVEYRGVRYWESEFEWVNPAERPELAAMGWDGIATQSYSTAVVIRLDPHDRDRVQVGCVLD